MGLVRINIDLCVILLKIVFRVHTRNTYITSEISIGIFDGETYYQSICHKYFDYT